jgi:sugar phosphate isomerase/epimerase
MTQLDVTRREFFRYSAIGTSAAALATLPLGGSSNPQARAAVGQPATKRDRMKTGLYTITFLGVWYRGRALTMEEIIQRAKQYGYDGIEIDGKRPHGNPLDWPTKRCKTIRAMAADQGVPIYAIAANNDFSSPICEHREAQVVYVRELVRMASELGAKTVRVFLAWSGVTKHPQIARYDIARGLWKQSHEKFGEEETWAWCRDCLSESAKHAGEYGVTLALQNHAPVIKSYKDMLRMIKEVSSPHLKACLDPGIEPNGWREDVIIPAAKEVGDLQVLSHFGGEFERKADGKITGGERQFFFVKGMAEIGYTGYIGYELCHPLPKVDGQTVGIEFAEKNAQLAREHMSALIAEHYGK